MTFDPLYFIDAYKIDHRRMYPEGTEYIYSNLTARGSRLDGVDYVIFFGLQAFIKRVLEDQFGEWFKLPVERAVAQYERRTDGVLGPNSVGSDHIRALHELGYLPLRFRALDEGTKVPLRIPLFTVENTNPEFFWLTNYIETMLSAETWLPTTTATIAYRMRGLLDDWAEKTGGDPTFVNFQGHDFSFRGMSSIESAAAGGAGHLLNFAGTDTMVALDFIEQYYPVNEGTWLGGSVPATEHSVMSAGGLETELETFERLLDLYPTGIVSIVSDTWDLWKVLTEYLPAMRQRIFEREGKLVIRPDSGDPADILCGTIQPLNPIPGIAVINSYMGDDVKPRSFEQKGVIELLWNAFGGTINDKGYKVLDPHVGAIYGDSITYDRADEISQRLADKGFASTNVVFGIGSYTYQYNTRDTLGFAMKATWAQINGKALDLFKNPVTDSGLKKSAKGRLAVIGTDNMLKLIEQAPSDLENSHDNLLRVVWEDGNFVREQTWDAVVARVGKRTL